MEKEAILLTHALTKQKATRNGIIVVEKELGQGARVIRRIAQVLDWRVEVFDAPKVNLNDLEERQSPFYQTIRHAIHSDLSYMLIFQDVSIKAMQDEQFEKKLTNLAYDLPVLVLLEDVPTRIYGWNICDLR